AKEAPLLGNNDQRPANSMLARFVLRRRFVGFRPKVGRLFDGTRSARNPSKLSEVTRPSAASCDKASSTCEGNKPLRRTSSLKKSAPPLCSASNTARLVTESSIAEFGWVNASQSVRFSRR